MPLSPTLQRGRVGEEQRVTSYMDSLAHTIFQYYQIQ